MLSNTDQCLLRAGIDAAKAKYAEVPKLSVHFAADASGLLQVTKGEAVIETAEEYTVKVRTSSAPPAQWLHLGRIALPVLLRFAHMFVSMPGGRVHRQAQIR